MGLTQVKRIGCSLVWLLKLFWELQRLCKEGQLNANPSDQAWTMMGTMDLQEEMSDDFNTHRVVVEESYLHVQRNAVLKTDFTHRERPVSRQIRLRVRYDYNFLQFSIFHRTQFCLDFFWSRIDLGKKAFKIC